MEENRIVLITGAKGGLGSFVTEAFLAAGDTVIGTSKSIQASDFSNPRFVAMASDLTDPASTSHLVDCVMQRFRRIDVLVHVMGGFSGGKPIGETDDATWDRMMNLNLRSGFNILRAVIPPMRASQRPCHDHARIHRPRRSGHKAVTPGKMISRKPRLAPAACPSTRETPRAKNAIAKTNPMAAYNVSAPTNSSAAMSGLLSVDRNRRARDLACGIRRKEHNEIGHVLRWYPA